MKLFLIALLEIVPDRPAGHRPYPVADIAFAMVFAAAFYCAAIVAVRTAGASTSEPAISL